MVDQDTLAALDALQWLRTGEEVSARFNMSPPTVSRQSRRCLDIFGVDTERINGEWSIIGDLSILSLERHVHQTARWIGHRSLRLEATYWSGPLLCTPPPSGWILGLSNIVGTPRNFQLIRDYIVDAFITGLPDIPSDDDQELTSIPLSSMPVFFVASPDHPLAAESRITLEDIARYPTLGLPSGMYPNTESALKSIGLWNDCSRMSRYRRDTWEGKAEDELIIGYATALSMEVSGGDLVRLPLNLPFASGEALVIRREYVNHPKTKSLCRHVVSRLTKFAEKHREIVIDRAYLDC